MKKISSIDNRGKVLFVDDKGTGTTTGSKSDCLNYGFKFRKNVCYCYDTAKKRVTTETKQKGNLLSLNSYALGAVNTLSKSIKNIAIGFSNLAQKTSVFGISIGRNAYTDKFGELAYSSCNTSNTAKYSTLMYTGTTNNNTATEIFLGGNDNARFYIDESKEGAYYIEAKLVVLDSAGNNAYFIHRYLLYKFANNTLTEVVEVPLLNQGDSALNAVTVDYAAVASTTDYIEVKVTGLASTRLDYNIVLTVTEVKNG